MNIGDFLEAAILTLIFILDLLVVRWIFDQNERETSPPQLVWKYLRVRHSSGFFKGYV
jgi:hypothetical protein